MDVPKYLCLAILFSASRSRRVKAPFFHYKTSLNETESKNKNGSPSQSSREHESKKLEMMLKSQLRFEKSVNSSSNGFPNQLQEFHLRILDLFRKFSQKKTEQSISINYSVDFMMNLYNYKFGDSKSQRNFHAKINNVLKKSDVVRCFEAIEFYEENSRWNAVFDTSAILPHERIRMAEVRLASFETEHNMSSLDIWDERRSQNYREPSLIRRKIGSISLSNKLSTKHTTLADITRTIRLLKNNKSTKNVKSQNIENESEDFPNDHEESQSPQFVSSSQPTTMLFVYSTNKDIELIDVATAHQGRSKRFSKRGQTRRRISSKYKKRKNRQKNRTERIQRKKKTRNNEIEIAFKRPQERQKNDLLEENQQQPKKQDILNRPEKQDDVVVLHDKIPGNSSPDKPMHQIYSWSGVNNPFFNPEISIKPTHCRRVDYTVDFEKIGWDDWIVFPMRYNAYRCIGECKVPLMASNKPTNHAFIQSVLSRNRPETGIAAPCCVPSKLQPLSILYYENGKVKQREHEDMVVAECDCR